MKSSKLTGDFRRIEKKCLISQLNKVSAEYSFDGSKERRKIDRWFD